MAKNQYNFSSGKTCFYCGKAVSGMHSQPHGLCAVHYKMRTEDIASGHQTNRLLDEMNNPDSFYNQVYRKSKSHEKA